MRGDHDRQRIRLSTSAGPPTRRQSLWRYLARRPARASEYTWALAFVVPYIAVFLAFVVYPVVYGLWMGSEPSLYAELFADPIYQNTVVNTLLFLALGVNVKMFLALLLSGFFMRPGWWMKALLMIFVLPWAVPAAADLHLDPLDAERRVGLAQQRALDPVRHRGPVLAQSNAGWRSARPSSRISGNGLPFWTVILLAGRMAIPQEIYDAAKVDGATGLRRFVHVTFPLLANLYLV